jgi:O-antigen ligase
MMNAIRLGMCALVASAVLSFGCVQPWSQAILEIGTAVLFVCWGVLAMRRQYAEIHWNWLYLPLLGLGALAMEQLAFGLTAYPYLTKIELLKWGAYVLLFFLALQSFRTEKQLKQFVWFLVVFGFVVSLFGIIQHFTFNGKLYWFVTLTSPARPFGPFVDSDHFAGFVELIAPLGLAVLLFRAYRREQLPLLLLFTIVPIGALILSTSRGGIIGLFLEIALLVYLARAHQIGKKQLLGATALALVAGTFIVWLGMSEAIERFEQLTHGGITKDLRASMYHDSWKIFVDHRWVGTGLGTLIAVYPHYATFFNGLTVDHAHNDYLELLVDTGLVGGFCGLAFISLLFWRGFANIRFAETRFSRAIVAGSLAACAGMLIHSLVDFNLHIPSNALIFVLLAAMATTEAREPQHNRCDLTATRGYPIVCSFARW